MSEQNRIAVDATEALRKFALSIIAPDGDYLTGDLSGDYVEEQALKFGLLEKKIINEPCCDVCLCAEYDADFPTECNRYTDVLKETAATAEANKPIAQLEGEVAELKEDSERYAMMRYWEGHASGRSENISERLYGEKVASDALALNAKLQAKNHDLSEALGKYVPKNAFKDDGRWFVTRNEDDGDIQIEVSEHAAALEALSTTPAESLAKRDDEVIEKCAKHLEERMYTTVSASLVRELKGK